MAKLILTDAEKAANSWLDLDDANLGKVLKATALKLKAHANDQSRLWFVSAAMLLCSMADDSNADRFSQTIKGFSNHGKLAGDWRVIVRRIAKFSGNPKSKI